MLLWITLLYIYVYTVNQAASGVEVAVFLSLCHHVFCSASAFGEKKKREKNKVFIQVGGGEGVICVYALKGMTIIIKEIEVAD